MKTVVLINGKKRSGKDYLSSLLRKQLNGEILSFASPMKAIIARTFGISLKELEDYKNREVDVFGTNFRKILQNFGTEAMKPVFGDNVWAKLCVDKAMDSHKDYIIISDWRFMVEYRELLSRNCTVIPINIHNDDLLQEDIHCSEQELEAFSKFKHTIDNTGQPDLTRLISQLVKEIAYKDDL